MCKYFSMFSYLRRFDTILQLQNATFKDKMTPSHLYELQGYFKNPYESLLGEMEGTLCKVSHHLYMPANEYGDRPVYIQELDPEDKRLYGNTAYFNEHLDKTNAKKFAQPPEE